MRILNVLCLLLGINACAFAQNGDFESFDLNLNEVLIDAPNGFWNEEPISLPNGYDEDFDFYFNWFISSMTDTTTPGFENQYSAITGSGNEGSQNYAIDYNFASDFSPTQIIIDNAFNDIFVHGMYLTNSTYAYLSMLNGDNFAKKFGGESGDDPDYFYLSFKGVKDGNITSDSLIFYLANFQFEDNSQDYIIDEWTYFDLSSLGQVDEYQVQYFSSDTGAFGINTPTYFCMDDVQWSFIDDVQDLSKNELNIFPNPSSGKLNFESNSEDNLLLSNMDGKIMRTWTEINIGQNSINLSEIPAGLYILRQKDLSFKLIRK